MWKGKERQQLHCKGTLGAGHVVSSLIYTQNTVAYRRLVTLHHAAWRACVVCFIPSFVLAATTFLSTNVLGKRD